MKWEKLANKFLLALHTGDKEEQKRLCDIMDAKKAKKKAKKVESKERPVVVHQHIV